MNIAKQAFWLCLTLIILIGSGRYYFNLNPIVTLDKETLSTTVDATVSKLTVRQFDSRGLLTNLLTTPRMEHIPKGDIHLFQNPHIIITQENEPAWDIRSKKGKSFDGSQRITFMEQVIVHQNQGAKNQESTLKTEEVTYYPKDKKATTDLFVTFEQPGNSIQSTGMNAYLDEKRIELLHQARGNYEPAKG